MPYNEYRSRTGGQKWTAVREEHMLENTTPRIKIQPNGPYIVTGNVPLYELIIEARGKGYVYRPGRAFPRREQYALCRCGQSANMPFCDGAHVSCAFRGGERASRKPYSAHAVTYRGPGVDLTDVEELCAFARFCHAEEGNVWELTLRSGDPHLKEMAIKTTVECPAGRLVAWDKETGEAIEPSYEPSIVLLQDPERGCSGPLWVRGGIQIEGADGYEYEVRNRVTLCRCGRSRNMPYCDAAHVSWGFKDQ